MTVEELVAAIQAILDQAVSDDGEPRALTDDEQERVAQYEAEIRRLKMGCLLAVAKGSAEPPRFISIEHRGGRRIYDIPRAS